MPPDVLAKVFEPFFTTKDKDKGTGLGLSMVFGFVKQSGGHIKIYSEVDIGTTVRLYLPRDDEVRDHATQSKSFSMPHGDEIVLVVEDSNALRRVLVKQLRELDYRVVDAANAHAAMEILERRADIDLLFTDIVMPGGMNGWELAKVAREIRPRLKVLFTSGFPATAFGSAGSVPEQVHLLAKPYRKVDLAQKLREILG
jgi:CheY-like chemotaxis protein